MNVQGRQPKSDPSGPGVFLRLPNQGNGLIVGTGTGTRLFWEDTSNALNKYWPDSTRHRRKRHALLSLDYLYSYRSLANTDPPEEGSITQILIGWGSGTIVPARAWTNAPNTESVWLRDKNVETLNSDSRGFTLVELMVGMLILAAAIAGALSFFIFQSQRGHEILSRQEYR